MPLLLEIAVMRQFDLHASPHASHIHQEAVNAINSRNDLLPFEYLFTPFCWTYMLLIMHSHRAG